MYLARRPNNCPRTQTYRTKWNRVSARSTRCQRRANIFWKMCRALLGRVKCWLCWAAGKKLITACCEEFTKINPQTIFGCYRFHYMQWCWQDHIAKCAVVSIAVRRSSIAFGRTCAQRNPCNCKAITFTMRLCPAGWPVYWIAKRSRAFDIPIDATNGSKNTIQTEIGKSRRSYSGGKWQ